jgi:hypothetical protein
MLTRACNREWHLHGIWMMCNAAADGISHDSNRMVRSITLFDALLNYSWTKFWFFFRDVPKLLSIKISDLNYASFSYFFKQKMCWPNVCWFRAANFPTFIHLVVCLTTGPKSLPKPALHIVRSRASSFKWEYPLLSLTLSNSFLRLLPCLPVTSIPPCIFPSITRCRRQFVRKMWTIYFYF